MTREYLLELGKRVKLIRKDLRISQKDFANKINISGSYLSEIESGKSKPFSSPAITEAGAATPQHIPMFPGPRAVTNDK
jgi:DNA-binding XRE family transcriptional regulator